MKAISVAYTSLSLPLSVANANFDIYYVKTGQNVWPSFPGGDWASYHVFGTDPTCEEVGDSPGWTERDDVSGEKWGVRCKDDGDSGACKGSASPSNIDVMELNFKDNHWTIYNDRDWGMYTKSNDRVGKCIPFPDHSFNCNIADGFGVSIGKRIFRCLTEYTAEEINEAR